MELTKIVFLALIFLSCNQRLSYGISDALHNFQAAVDDVKKELDGLKAVLSIDDETLLRQRRHTIDEMLAKFENGETIQGERQGVNDILTSKIMEQDARCSSKSCGPKQNEKADPCKKPCSSKRKRKKYGYNDDISYSDRAQNSKNNDVLDGYDTETDQDSEGNVNWPIKNSYRSGYKSSKGLTDALDLSSRLIPSSNFESLNGNAKQGQDHLMLESSKKRNNADDMDFDADLYSESDDDNGYMNTIKNINFPSVATDQFNSAKNDLSHEANYKLSKIEQDASEKKKSAKWNWKSPLKMPLHKRNSDFNAMNEIKLKTSHRLMRKGLGASLPSSALVDSRHDVNIDDMLKKMEQGVSSDSKNKDYDKYEYTTLMGTLDSESDDEMGSRLKRLNTKNKQLKLDNDLDLFNSRSDEPLGDNNPTNNIYTMPFLRTKRISPADNDEMVPFVNEEKEDEQMPQSDMDYGMDSINGLSDISDDVMDSDGKDAAEDSSNDFEYTEKTVEKRNQKTNAAEESESESEPELDKMNKAIQANEAKEKRRVKRIGMLDPEGFVRVREVSADLLPPTSDELVAKNRRKRSIGSEITPNVATNDSRGVMGSGIYRNSTDRKFKNRFRSANDTYKHRDVNNSDRNYNGKFRNAKENVQILDTNQRQLKYSVSKRRKPSHRIHKRSTRLFDDINDNNSESSKMEKLLGRAKASTGTVASGNADDRAEDVNLSDADYLEFVDRNKRGNDRNLDFETATNDFGQEKFDNLKQNEAEMGKFDDLKFDNMWYDNKKPSKYNRKEIHGYSRTGKSSGKNYHVPLDGDTSTSASASAYNKYTNSHETSHHSRFAKPKEGQECKMLHEDKANNGTNVDKTMIIALRNEILNCSAFQNLETFLKQATQNHSIPKTNDQIEVTVAQIGTANTTETPTPNTTATSATNEKPATTEASAKKDDLMKLNITINASVTGDQYAKKFFGNGTINVNPGFGEDRERRGIKYPDTFDQEKRRSCQSDFKPSKHYKAGCGMGQSNDDNTNSFPLDNVVTGKLSSQVVKSIFGLVRTNPKLQVLWPSLKNNGPATRQQVKNFYAIRNQDTESEMQRTEQMMHRAMETINDIIDQQVRSRTCIPLRPDLRQFYEQILRTFAEQEKTREKREVHLAIPSDFSKEVRAIDPYKIEEKSRVVKKLLKQYEELPIEDQERVTDIRDDLLMDLVYLRRLKEFQETAQDRRKREIIGSQHLNLPKNESVLVKRMESDYSKEFLKLIKTSEMFRETAAEPDER